MYMENIMKYHTRKIFHGVFVASSQFVILNHKNVH